MKNRFRNNGNSSNIYICWINENHPALRPPPQGTEIANRIKILLMLYKLSSF